MNLFWGALFFLPNFGVLDGRTGITKLRVGESPVSYECEEDDEGLQEGGETCEYQSPLVLAH